MQMTLPNDVLIEKLTIATRFTSSRGGSVEILQGVLIQGEKDIIHVYASTLNSFYHTSIPQTVEKPFRIIVEPRKILEFLQLLTKNTITVTVSEKQITITQDKTKGHFPLMQSDDFPFPPSMETSDTRLDSHTWFDLLPLVLFAASRDEARPALTGINFVHTDDAFHIVATDGFRLSLLAFPTKGNMPSIIVPSDFLAEVIRNVKDSKKFSFAYSDKEKILSISSGADTYYSRIIDADFPLYGKVIPDKTETTVRVNKDELIRNIKLISVFARDYSHVIVCEFAEGGLRIRPKKEANAENIAFQEMEMQGVGMTVAFNYRYVLDYLNHVYTDDVIIELLRPDAPVIFKPATAKQNDTTKTFIHVIMPIRLQE